LRRDASKKKPRAADRATRWLQKQTTETTLPFVKEILKKSGGRAASQEIAEKRGLETKEGNKNIRVE